MSETFDDIRMAFGVIVENYNAVEQYFYEAVAFATGDDVDTSARIIKARRQIETLKGLLKESLKLDVQRAGKVVAFGALMDRFDALQQSRNDGIHSRWLRIEDPTQGSGLKIRILKGGTKTARYFYASDLRKLANDIEDFGADFRDFLLNISPSAKAAHENFMKELINAVN